MKIAVIPARGGSKRIPRKNIKEFHGKPMLAWSIEAAKKSQLFERIIVSTDDAEIAEIAGHWGAETPFVRPEELADDYVGTTDVIAHAVQWAINEGLNLEAACCIYATAPFIRTEDLKLGWALLAESKFIFAFSATEFPSSIFRSFRQLESGAVEMFFPKEFGTRSQDLPVALHDAAQFYWGTADAWLQRKRVFEKHSTTVYIPRWRVHDIDTEEDWIRAEAFGAILLR